MARIKCVLNERRLAYEGAVKIFEAQKAAHESEAQTASESQIQAEEKEERKEKAIPEGVKLAGEGLFESVAEQPVKA